MPQDPRHIDYDGQALQQMAGRPISSHPFDFAFNEPKAPFGPNPQFNSYQQPGQQGRDALAGRPTGGGINAQRITKDGVTFVSRGPANNGMTLPANGNAGQDARAAMLDDMGNIQAAGNRQFDRGNLVNNDMYRGIQEAPGQIVGAANREAGRMDQFASRLEDPNGAGQKDADLANKYAADAVQTQKDAVSKYQDENAQTMASTSEAIQRSFQQQQNEINNSDMTDEEKQSALFQLKGQMRSQISQAVAPMVTRGQEMLAQLRNNVAQTQMAAGQTALGAGQQRSNTLQMAQHAREWSGNMRAMAPVTAAQLQMQGRTALAGMIQNNPETVVSKFQGMMGIYGAEQAYGARVYGFGDPGPMKRQGLSGDIGSRLW